MAKRKQKHTNSWLSLSKPKIDKLRRVRRFSFWSWVHVPLLKEFQSQEGRKTESGREFHSVPVNGRKEGRYWLSLALVRWTKYEIKGNVLCNSAAERITKLRSVIKIKIMIVYSKRRNILTVFDIEDRSRRATDETKTFNSGLLDKHSIHNKYTPY